MSKQTGGNAPSSSMPAFRDFVPEMLDALDQTLQSMQTDDFDLPTVFCHWAARTYGSPDPSQYVISDGGREVGIDFFLRSEPKFSIFQCKALSLERLTALTEAPTFDANAVNELLEAVSFLLNSDSQFDAVREDVRALRSRYQRSLKDSPETTRLTATLVVLGQLTPGGRDRFGSERERLLEQGVHLELVDWTDIYRELHTLDAAPTRDLRLDLEVDDANRDVLPQNDWFFALAYAEGLVSAFEAHGVTLFDLNVRHEIPGSKVNRAIVDSLSSSRGRKVFHHLNNGLLIVCRHYRLPRGQAENVIRVFQPQIVNGCQTVTSLWRAYRDLTPRDQEEFRKHVKVAVKVIQQVDQELLDEVVITTNNQNQMRPRNLRSNGREQLEIQKAFRELPDKWFYVRKDGEFDAMLLRDRAVAWFRKRDFAVAGRGRPRYRRIDNEEVAKAWLAWIGHSGRALQGGVDYFGDDSVYELVFKARPTARYWQLFCEAEFARTSDVHLEPISPTAHQYLLASTIHTYVRRTTPSAIQNRRTTTLRLVASGVLKGDAESGRVYSNRADVAAALAEDREYQVNAYLANMSPVLTELCSFVLSIRHGSLGPTESRALLMQRDLAAWTRSAFSDTPPGEEAKDGVVWRVTEFVKWSLRNYFATYRAEIETASRPLLYFARRESITNMRKAIVQANSLSEDVMNPWKRSYGKRFIDTLPELGA